MTVLAFSFLGHDLAIPMPGHAVSGAAEVEARAAVAKLEALIAEHDAVFLLMDSRESRWLPTVIAAAQNKICLTAAVGFDTYVAMRHGVEPTDTQAGNLGGVQDASKQPRQRNVGCYFCNDVVAPVNSQKDRSLDQQCTVSRPGVSMAVSAAVVEQLIAVNEQ